MQECTPPENLETCCSDLRLCSLCRTPYTKLAAALIIDVLSTQWVPMPALVKILVGQAGKISLQNSYDASGLSRLLNLKSTNLEIAVCLPGLVIFCTCMSTQFDASTLICMHPCNGKMALPLSYILYSTNRVHDLRLGGATNE